MNLPKNDELQKCQNIAYTTTSLDECAKRRKTTANNPVDNASTNITD